MATTYSMTLSREQTNKDEDFDEDDIDIEVVYSIFGRRRPATWEEPAEFPELEIENVTDGEGNPIKTTPKEDERIEEAIWDSLRDD